MKQTLFLLCLLTTGLSAQTTTDDHIRARSSFRIGSTSSTAATGIVNTMPGSPSTQLITAAGVYNWATGSLTFSGDVSGLYNNLTLANSGVTAGTCTNCSLTIDAKGRVTVKGSGTAPVIYTGGTGINVTGSVITNTAPNVVQTLSIVGSNLSLSGGGGTVAIPGGGSLPAARIGFGDGSTIVSDTGLLFQSRTLYAPNLRMLPTTNSTTGILYSGATPMLHFYGTNDSILADNIFMGRGTGNFTMGPGSAKYMGKKNTVIGPGSLPNATTAYLNTSMGWENLKNCTTCAGSIAMGGHVLENLIESHDNIGIGDQVMRNLLSGPENTGTGYSVFLNLLNGTRNYGGGYGAGGSLISGEYNTFLGAVANTSLTTGLTNSTALGANSVVTKSNQVVLGGSGVTEVYAVGTVLAGKLGANIRVTGPGTTTGDGAVLAGATGNIWFSNWDANRGILVAATTGNITQLGSGNFQVGKLGANTTPDATAAMNVGGTSLFSGTINANSVGANVRLKSTAGTTDLDGFLGLGGGSNILLANWNNTRGLDIKSTGIVEQIGNYAFKIGSGAGVPTGAVGYIKHNTSTSTFQVVPTGTTWLDVVTSTYGGSLTLSTAGNKINIATGSNASIGTATLASGTVTVNTTAVTSSSQIIVCYNTPSGTLASGLSAPSASIVNGTSFVINSLTTAGLVNTFDTSTVRW